VPVITTRLPVLPHATDHRGMKTEPTPIVSRVLPDGTLLETVYDPVAVTTVLAVGYSDGRIETAPHFDLPDGTRLAPYSANNNLLTSGCVLLPSAIGEVGDFGDLVDGIRVYLARYVDLTPGFLQLAPYYVLLSWAFDAFNEVPYLRLQGDWGTGKTRALLALGSITYKPFFASGASTVSPIFHVLDAFGGTLILDEADFRFSDATSELTKILNNGTVRGLPVLRTMTNRHKELNPTAFRVFGPKLLAMRGSFGDDALESRFLTEQMTRRPLPSHIPFNTPDALHVAARGLRNRLLAWRLACFHSIKPDLDARILGVDARKNQMALPLLSLVPEPGERERIAAWISGLRQPDRANTDALVVSALVNAFVDASTPYIPISEIAERLNERLVADGDTPMTNKWVGGVIRRLGISTTKTNGTYAIHSIERRRIEALAQRLCVQRDPTVSNPTPDNPASVPHVSIEDEETGSMGEQSLATA